MIYMTTFLWYHYVIGAVLFVASVVIIVIVMMQKSRQAGLSGAISGGADTFFGKNKGRTVDSKLAKWTKIISVIFFVIALASVVMFAFLN